MSEGEKKKATELGFNEALAELESILAKIEGEEIDIDRLASELKRATALLEICRSKVRKAEAEVTQIVEGMESGEGGAGAGQEDD